MRTGLTHIDNVVAIPGDPAWASLVKNSDGTHTLRQTGEDDIVIEVDDSAEAAKVSAILVAQTSDINLARNL